jgi:hypothetical protein
MAHDTHLAPHEEAVGLAIDSYIAALTDDQVDALLGVPANRSWNAIRR